MTLLSREFQPKEQRCTPTHKKIIRLPFKGILTTNYDNCLEEAFIESHISTTYGQGKDNAIVTRWNNGLIFQQKSFPILYLHGRYDFPERITLTETDYREHYNSEPYKSFIENIWSQKSIFFIGFSFSDFWLDYLATNMLSQFPSLSSNHFAILSIGKKSQYSSALRKRFLRRYKLNAIFFPTKTDDQSDTDPADYSMLQHILDYLVEKTEIARPPENF